MTDDPLARALAADPLLAAVHRAGRRHRAARALAADELSEGLWVEDEDPVEELVRLAAETAGTRTYRSEGLVVALVAQAEVLTATQLEGASGFTLVFGDIQLPLEPGRTVRVPVADLPETLVALDASGRGVVLLP